MNRRAFLSASAALAGPATARRTNVVVFMTDDHGAWSLGCYGNPEGHTPNVDQVAARGVRFTRAFAAAAVCSPSRMTYMTGKLPFQHGVQDYIVGEETSGPGAKRFLDGHTAYPEILKRHGYTLGYFGKWHMGDDATPQKGFSSWFTVAGGPYRRPRVFRKDGFEEFDVFKSDLITDRALQFLDENRDRPFFLHVGDNAPHDPYDYQPDEYRRPYLDSDFPAFPNESPHPNQIASYRKYLGRRESKLSYMALVRGADANLGRILRKLDELKLRESTLIVFCADQGFNCGHHGVWGKGNGTLPFNMYEQTLRIPFLFCHAGHIPEGRVLDPMVSTYDFFPTLLDYLGLPPHRDSKMPGRSFAGFLRGESPRWRNRIFAEYSYVRTMRTDRFKYVQRAEGHPDEFFDLDADPGERRNLAPDPRGSGMKDEIATWFGALGAPPVQEWRSTCKVKLSREHYPGR